MDDRPCQAYHDQLDAALQTLQHIQASQEGDKTSTAAEGDFAERFYDDIARLADAKRCYRAAVRALIECMSQQAQAH